MAFGSYDESEQDTQSFDSDVEDDGGSTLPTHDGDIVFEYGDATSEDLLKTFEEIRDA